MTPHPSDRSSGSAVPDGEEIVVPYIRECDYAVRKPWRVPERRLLDYLLVFVLRGRCIFTVDGHEHEFGEGDFALIQPGSLCALEGVTDTETPFAHFDIFYRPERDRSFPTRPGQVDLSAYLHLLQPRIDAYAGFPVPVRLQPKRPIAMRETMLRLVDAWLARGPHDRLRAQAAATELVASILADHAPARRAGAREESPPLNWVTSFLSHRLHEPITVEEMADRAHLSPSRFSALFKQQFGVPPHRYFMRLRIGHAGELLTTTALPQEDIAAYCGFANVHHFSKTFKREMGVTPGAWRSLSLSREGTQR